MRRVALAVLVGLMLMTAAPAFAQRRHSMPHEQFFNVRWEIERRDGRDIAIVGSLDNHYLHAVREVLLQAQVLDAGGHMTQETFGRLAGAVPAGGRVTFRLPLAGEGARYAVLVHAFEFAPAESP